MNIYRRLTIEELSLLEKEFIEFLIVQGIDASDWEKLKSNHLSEANQLVDNFSDMVLDTTLKKVKYLEFISTNKIHVYQCLQEQLVLVAIEAPENLLIDFTDLEKRKSYMDKVPDGLKIYTTSKLYHPTRELELYKLTQLGCLISDDKLFKSISMML
jgi:hypothetical protein